MFPSRAVRPACLPGGSSQKAETTPAKAEITKAKAEKLKPAPAKVEMLKLKRAKAEKLKTETGGQRIDTLESRKLKSALKAESRKQKWDRRTARKDGVSSLSPDTILKGFQHLVCDPKLTPIPERGTALT